MLPGHAGINSDVSGSTHTSVPFAARLKELSSLCFVNVQCFVTEMARQAYSVPRKKLFEVFVVLICACLTVDTVCAEQTWDHVVDLDQNYQLLWTVRDPDIVFEVRVRTQGYIGFGFSRDGTIYGADVFIGWIDNGHTFFHVSALR